MGLDDYVEHLLGGDSEYCLAAAREQAVDLEGLHELYVGVIQPSQYRVGELWESGKISVAAEHLATATNSYVASMCYAPLARGTTGGPRALIACVPEETHDLGARMLADLLESDGWDVDFYGSSMPMRDLIGAIRERKPRFAGLSAALTLHLDSVKRVIAAIRTAPGLDPLPIAVGGYAFRGERELWRQVDADLCGSDASSAVKMLSRLKGD